MTLKILVKKLIADFKKYKKYKNDTKTPMTFKDVIEYFIGNWRMYLHYNYPSLLSKKTLEIFNLRLQWMHKKCLEDNACVICKCDTPALQYCNKTCEGKCYPPMFTDKEYKNFKSIGFFINEQGALFHSNGSKTTI